MSDQEGVIAWSLKAPSKKIAQKKTRKQAWRFFLILLFIRDPSLRKFKLC